MEKKPLVKEAVAEELKSFVNRLRTNTELKISSERELCEQFHVSRVTLRAAIKELVKEDILVQIKGKGTYITPKNDIRSIHLICSPKIKNNDPFYLKFLSELTNAASKQSIHIYMVDAEQPELVHPDAPLVIIGLLEEQLLNRLLLSYKTVIAIQDYSSYNHIISQLYFNDYKIGTEAARLLANYNHKKLLLLAGPEKYPSSNYRKTGFLDAARDLGLETLVFDDKMNWAGGYRAGDYFKSLPKEKAPTAAFAANDWMAIGFMQKLKENGVRIPKDISVVGCDDIPLSDEFVPTLTTFNLDMKYLVMELFSLINKLSVTTEDMTKKVLLPASLVIRESLIRL